jgi:hypothetical protein
MAFTGKRLSASAMGLDWGAATGPEATAKGEPAKLEAAPRTTENGLANAAGGALTLAGASWTGWETSKMPITRAMGRVTSISSSARNGRWKRSGQAAWIWDKRSTGPPVCIDCRSESNGSGTV